MQLSGKYQSPDRKIKTQSLTASLHPPRSSSTPDAAVAVSVGLQSTVSANLRTKPQKFFFPESQVSHLQIISGWTYKSEDLPATITARTKTTKATAKLSQHISTHCSCTGGSLWLQGTTLYVINLEMHCPPHSPQGRYPETKATSQRTCQPPLTIRAFSSTLPLPNPRPQKFETPGLPVKMEA